MERFFVMTQELESRLENQPKDLLWGDGRLLNSMGFLNSAITDTLKTLPKIIEEGSAIIVAEGGMGKTFLLKEMEQLYASGDVLLLDLSLYVSDTNGLKDCIRSANSKKCLLIDSFDEATQLEGCLLNALKELDGAVHVILASRGVLQLSSFPTQLKWPMYSLLPYSEENVLEVAQKQLDDADVFLEEVKKKNIGSVCAKPLGCELLMSSFKDGRLTNVSNRDLWKKAIKKLCAENPNSDSHFRVNKTLLTCDAALNIAIQIALVLKLSNASTVSSVSGFTDGIDFSQVIQSLDGVKFNECLQRPIFLAIDPRHYKFSHISYFDFLAAEGLAQYVAPSEWQKIIFAPNGQPYPQWEGVLQWVVGKDDKILEQAIGVRPDLLLGSDVIGNKVSIEDICNFILMNADNLPDDIRENPAIQSCFYLLNTDGCAQIIQDVLMDGESDSKIDLAFDIIRKARLLQIVDSVVTFFCDSTKSLSSRISAGYVLLEFANEAQKERCRSLLDSSIPNRIKGMLLKLLWPNKLSATELINLLIPRRESILDSYSLWLSHDFPSSLGCCSIDDLLELLTWANKNIGKDEDHHFSDALHSIFLHCWKIFDVKTCQGLKLLARGLEGYVSRHSSPFSSFDVRQSSHLGYTEVDYKKDVVRRQRIVKFIIENVDLSLSPVMNFHVGLIQHNEDIEFLIRELRACDNLEIQKRWVQCLSYYFYYIALPQHAKDWDWLHQNYPSYFEKSAFEELAEREKNKKLHLQEQEKLDLNKKEREANKEALCKSDVKFIKESLKSKIDVDMFPQVMARICRHPIGEQDDCSLDVRKSYLWSSLSQEGVAILVAAAYDFMLNSNEPSLTGNRYHPEYFQALYLLMAYDQDRLVKLPLEQWQKFIPEILTMFVWNGSDLIQKIVKILVEGHWEAFLDGVTVKFKREMNEDGLNLFGLDKFTNLLTRAELMSLLSKLDDVQLTSVQRASLYETFWMESPDVTLEYLGKKEFLDIDLVECADELIPYLIVCNPEKRFQELLDLFEQNIERGKTWVLKVLGNDWSERGVFSQIIAQQPTMALANFYIWLRTQFPPEKEPKHIGCYSPTQLDYVYSFTSRIINILIASNEDDLPNALECILDNFPSLIRLRDLKLQAERRLLEKGCPHHSIDVIKALMEKKTGLVNSAQDLLDIVYERLDNFQEVLTGADTPLVGLLWNITPSGISHKKEEDLSDFLKYFLSQELKKCVINREVQLSRKRGDVAGARTDIWITAFSQTDNAKINLCIEVKGSWNGECKTAFKNQLCGKYMADGGADAGIFLVGWFEQRSDKNRNSWSTKEAAQIELNTQEAQLRENGCCVRGIVIDCSY